MAPWKIDAVQIFILQWLSSFLPKSAVFLVDGRCVVVAAAAAAAALPFNASPSELRRPPLRLFNPVLIWALPHVCVSVRGESL